MIFSLLFSFTVTVILEETLGLILGFREKKGVLFIFLVNLVTNPVLVFIMYSIHLLALPGEYLFLLILELAAVATEALLYKGALPPGKNPLLFSLSLNLFSFFGGKIIELLIKQVLL